MALCWHVREVTAFEDSQWRLYNQRLSCPSGGVGVGGGEACPWPEEAPRGERRAQRGHAGAGGSRCEPGHQLSPRSLSREFW